MGKCVKKKKKKKKDFGEIRGIGLYIYIAGHGWSVGKEELGVVNNGRVVNCKSAGW
jgi:hypothetical protein